MTQPKDTLELRIEHAATPRRVVAAAQLLAEVLAPILPESMDEGNDDALARDPVITVVVSNYDMRATVRVWDAQYEPKVDAIAQFIRDPSEVTEEFAEVAEALARYARVEERFHPSFWYSQNGQPQRIRSVDVHFADAVEKLVKQRRSIPHRLHGATYITSRLYRLGRKDKDSPFKVRLLLPNGNHADVEVETAAVPMFLKAFENGADIKEHRVKLLGNWIRREDKIEFSDAKLKATGVDDRVITGTGIALLKEMSDAPLLKRAEAANILRRLRGEDDDEDQD